MENTLSDAETVAIAVPADRASDSAMKRRRVTSRGIAHASTIALRNEYSVWESNHETPGFSRPAAPCYSLARTGAVSGSVFQQS